jgi:amino acid transporter
MAKMLGTVAFTALAISSIFTPSNLAVLAANGGAFFALLLISIILFFVPTALVVGELTTGNWGTNIFTWVQAAFGKKVGLAAVFWQWFQAIVMILPMLYFVVGTFTYCIGMPELNTNPVTQFLLAVIFYVVLAFIVVVRPRLLISLEAFGFWCCAIVPVTILFIISTMYLLEGNTAAFPFEFSSFIPKWDLQSFLALIPYISCLTGIEISGPFVSRLKNIKQNYPKAILVVMVMAIIANLFGSGAIAVIFPPDKINLSSGFIETYDFLFQHYGYPIWLVKVLGLMSVFGTLIKTSNWQVSPAIALNSCADTGLLPKKFSYINSQGTPAYIILVQLIAFVILGIAFSFSSSGNIAFLIGVYLDVSIYCCMYVLMFLSYFKIKKMYPTVQTIFTMPKSLRTIVPLVGLLTVLIIIGLCFIPPGGVTHNDYVLYISILVIAFLAAFITPFLLGAFFSKEHHLEK